jgi:hypothetical protein
MSLFAVLATGPSMSQALADRVRGIRAVAVSDAYRLAPWADAMVSADEKWWRHHPEALRFRGHKFCGLKCPGTVRLPRSHEFPPGTNSGLQGMRVAQMLGATKILLVGFDMHGSHFFGPHGGTLKNTSLERFEAFKAQFATWRGCEVVNCTTGSGLTCYRMGSLDAELSSARLVA